MPSQPPRSPGEQAWRRQVKLWEDSNDDEDVDDNGDNYNKAFNMMMDSPINLFKLTKQPLSLWEISGAEAGIFL